MRALLGVVVVTVGVGLASPAKGYVRTTVGSGMAVSWPRTNLKLVETQGLSRDLEIDVVREVVRKAMAAWSSPAVPCTSMQLELGIGFGSPPVVASDLLPYLIFREDTWEYDAGALAITTVFARRTDGEILDADIEINAVNHRWAVIPEGGPNPVPGASDLGNTITHELGHFLGLDHVCALLSVGPRQVDHLGNPVPTCASAPAGLSESTMSPATDMNETSKRTLASDDIQAVCDIYLRAAGAGDAGAPDGGVDTRGAVVNPGTPDSQPTMHAGAEPPGNAGLDGYLSGGPPGCSCRLGGGEPSLSASLLALLLILVRLRRRGARRGAVQR